MEKVALMLNEKWLTAKKWVKENPLEFIILIIILVVGAFFRLYRIDQYMTFLGDEGRDAIVVRRFLVNGDLIGVGPGTSIGNMYLGPFYYYLMAPALLLANFSPVGPAVMIALLGVVTIFFVWWVAREWFTIGNGQGYSLSVAGLVAAGLYAITPVVIIYSRSSWNPNIMPFFSLLCIYSIWHVWSSSAKASEGQAEDSKRFKWLIVLGISYAFVLQSHYLGLLLAPVIGFFWILTLKKVLSEREDLKLFLKRSLMAAIIFGLLMSPLVIFDTRHDWRNFEAIKTFFTQRQTTVSARPWTAIPKLSTTILKVSTSLLAAKNDRVGKWVGIGIVIVNIWLATTLLYSNVVAKKRINPYLLLFVWLGAALIGLGLYKQEIYDHYYGFFFTAPALLVGGLSQHVVQSAKNIGKVIIFIFVSLLVILNLRNNPLKNPPNRQLPRTIEVSKKIIEESKNNKFNIAVIAERNYEGAYQYFLEKWNAPIVMIDPQKAKETITEQLFVVCELPQEKCDPTHNPKTQVANFGWSKIDNSWQIGGVFLYRLIHY